MGENLISNKIITHTILDGVKSDFERIEGKDSKEITARPWNFYQPDTSLWWIRFTKDFPSEKYGKLAIYKHLDRHRIGLHLEKGISGEVAKELGISSKQAEKVIVSSSWKWNLFIEDIKTGELKEALSNITSELDKDLKISIDFYPYNKAKNDSVLDSMISFELDKNRLKDDNYLNYVEDESKGEISEFIEINNLEGLLKIFGKKEAEKNNQKDWYWINVYIVVELDENEILDPYKYASPFIYNMGKYFND